jgi:hypothetical protein
MFGYVEQKLLVGNMFCRNKIKIELVCNRPSGFSSRYPNMCDRTNIIGYRDTLALGVWFYMMLIAHLAHCRRMAAMLRKNTERIDRMSKVLKLPTTGPCGICLCNERACNYAGRDDDGVGLFTHRVIEQSERMMFVMENVTWLRQLID